MDKCKKHIVPLLWVTKNWIARLNKFLPLEPDTMYGVSEVAAFLQAPSSFLVNQTKGFKSRTSIYRGTGRSGSMICVSGKELQPLLESCKLRAPKKPRKVAQLMQLETPKIIQSELVCTDMGKVSELVGKLQDQLDKLPKDMAREVSFQLARQYCRSRSQTKGLRSGKKKIPSKNNLETKMEKSTT